MNELFPDPVAPMTATTAISVLEAGQARCPISLQGCDCNLQRKTIK